MAERMILGDPNIVCQILDFIDFDILAAMKVRRVSRSFDAAYRQILADYKVNRCVIVHISYDIRGYDYGWSASEDSNEALLARLPRWFKLGDCIISHEGNKLYWAGDHFLRTNDIHRNLNIRMFPRMDYFMRPARMGRRDGVQDDVLRVYFAPDDYTAMDGVQYIKILDLENDPEPKIVAQVNQLADKWTGQKIMLVSYAIDDCAKMYFAMGSRHYNAPILATVGAFPYNTILYY